MSPQPYDRLEGCRTGSERAGCRAFTLLEVMMVVVIISILAAMAIPNMIKATRKARRTEAVQALMQIRSAVLRWQAENSRCPDPNLAAEVNLATSYDAVFQTTTASWTYSVQSACRTNANGLPLTLPITCLMSIDANGLITGTAGTLGGDIAPDGTTPGSHCG